MGVWVMAMKKEIATTKKYAPLISLLLGAAMIATTAAYLIYKYVNKKAYLKKWEEYDECGLA